MLQKTSIGLMQVMGGVYRQYGYKGWLSAIFSSPENQLDYGCRHLAAKIEKYGLSPGISAYNAGSPTNANQAYVDRVLKYAEEWIPF
jgi:soluble lytic murein transglycosylase-like protein